MDVLMTSWVFLIGLGSGVLAGVLLSFRTAVHPLHRRIESLTAHPHQQQLMDTYPFPRHRFRSIGDPVDGIQFEDDQILFVVFRSSDRALTNEQSRIHQLIKEKKVTWYEYTTAQ
ncbi:MAG: hypothetical protein JXA00_06435 [Candidatus Thermoplasmatota archaeon]|nr:hypothetical protein [Candidatus Thermoplasmatota archaeon]